LNAHTEGYIWKRLGNVLDMNKTLEENNIKDESQQFEMLGMDEDEYLPGKKKKKFFENTLKIL